jgi:hypothetical protein
MSADNSPAMTGKERTALSRARKSAGDFVTSPVDVSAETAQKLVELGLASKDELSDKRILADVVSDFLDCWGRGTLDPPS